MAWKLTKILHSFRVPLVSGKEQGFEVESQTRALDTREIRSLGLRIPVGLRGFRPAGRQGKVRRNSREGWQRFRVQIVPLGIFRSFLLDSWS